eukprot:g1977.t1
MTTELDKMHGDLSHGRVPAVWEALAYPSCKKLHSWFDDFTERYLWLKQKWLLPTSSTSSFVLQHYWISAFFFPQGFLTAVLQSYARRHALPVDALGFAFVPGGAAVLIQFIFYNFYFRVDMSRQLAQEQAEKAQHDNSFVWIYGLFFEGALWDFNQNLLADQEPGMMYANAPWIKFVCRQEQGEGVDGGTSAGKSIYFQYLCPLYKTPSRSGSLSTTGLSSNFIIAIALDSDKKEEYWVLKGCALLTMLPDL